MSTLPHPAAQPEIGGESRLRRREFLIAGIKVSTVFLASGLFTSIGKAVGAGPSVPATTEIITPPGLDDSIALLAAYLTSYRPPAGAFSASGPWQGKYEIIEWQGSTLGSPFSRRNKVLGRYAVERLAGANPAYTLDYTLTFGGFRTAFRSKMHCTTAALPGLMNWQTDYQMHPVGKPAAITRLHEEGICRPGEIEIRSGSGRRRLLTDRAVLPQWGIVDALRTASPAEFPGAEFDLLHDLTSYRPQQRLRSVGELQVRLNGANHSLHGYLLTGRGTEPTHYWVDDRGRTLLITGGLLANALVSAS